MNNTEELMALMLKDKEELARDAGMSIEQADNEVLRIENSHKVNKLLSLSNESSPVLGHVMKQIRMHRWSHEQTGIIDMIEATGDINSRSKVGGSTILMYASHNGHVELVKVLLENGALKSIKSNKGKTALDYALKLYFGIMNKPAQKNYMERLKQIIDLLNEKKTSLIDVVDVLSCCRDQHLVCFAKAIKDSLDADAYIDDLNALHQASWRKNESVVKVLLEYGASIDLLTKDDRKTALILAAKRGNPHIVEQLLAKGPILDAKDANMLTALDYARDGIDSDPLNDDFVKIYNQLADAMKGGIRAVADSKPSDLDTLYDYLDSKSMDEWKILLENSKDIDASNAQGENLLKAAVLNGDLDLLKILIDSGANPNIKDSKSRTPLTLAKSVFKSDFATYKKIEDIISKSPSYDDDLNLDNILGYLNFKGRTPWANLIEAADCDIEAKDSYGTCITFLSVKTKDFPLLKLILNYGIRLNHMEFDGCTPYQYALKLFDETGDEEFGMIAEMISETKGFDPSLNRSSMKRLFDYLAENSMMQWKNVIGLQMDIDGRFPLDAEEYAWHTLLMVAVLKRDVHLIKMLIDLGADPNLTDPKGKTPFQSAKLIHNDDPSVSGSIYKLLKSSPVHPPKKDVEIIIDYLEGADMSDWIDIIIKNDYDIETPDSDGRNLLFMAIQIKNLDLIKLILDYGADLNHAVFNGKTPYLFAKKLQKDYHGTEEDYGLIAEMIKSSPGFISSRNIEVYTGNQ